MKILITICFIVLLSPSALAEELELINRRYISPLEASEEILGVWELQWVGTIDSRIWATYFPDKIEFKQGGEATRTITGIGDVQGIWEIIEFNSELWLRVFFETRESWVRKLIFQESMIFLYNGIMSDSAEYHILAYHRLD